MMKPVSKLRDKSDCKLPAVYSYCKWERVPIHFLHTTQVRKCIKILWCQGRGHPPNLLCAAWNVDCTPTRHDLIFYWRGKHYTADWEKDKSAYTTSAYTRGIESKNSLWLFASHRVTFYGRGHHLSISRWKCNWLIYAWTPLMYIRYVEIWQKGK